MAAPNDGMGSLLYPNGDCRFRVWAPFAQSVAIFGDFNGWNQAPGFPLGPEIGGNWSGVVANVKPGQLYKYIITNRGGPGNDASQLWLRADARALQVENSNDASASYVTSIRAAFRTPFVTPGFENFLLYQLHIGSFSGLNDVTASPVINRTATFNHLGEKLQYIKNLGFNGIALLPIGDVFADLKAQGGVGEGYQGTSDMFAPEEAYASRKDLAVEELVQLIDKAHSIGLSIIVDVVYNHGAYTDNRYWRYDGNFYDNGGEYFEAGHDTRFGSGFAVWRQEVKDFFLDNARMFLRDYQVDGIRFDATQFIQPDALQFLAWSLRSEFPNKYLIAEYNPNDYESAAPAMDPFNALGFHATWDLSGPEQMSAALSGNSAVDNLWKIIGDFQNPNPWCSIRYLAGSHDQIGTSFGREYLVERFGGRTNGWALAKARLAWALTVVIPGTPMLFMGSDGNLDHWWDPDNIYGEHRVDWAKMGDPTGAPMQRLVADINALRWQHPALRSPAGNGVHTDYQGQVVAFKRYTNDGDLLLIVVNVSDNQWAFHDYGVNLGGESGSWIEIFNSQSPTYGGINTTGNYSETLSASEGYLHINLPRWSLLVFKKAA